MASILKPKRRTADATAPTTANLADGEVAINHVSKTIYQRIGAAVVAVANYFTDAPSDGNTYGRKDAGWVTLSGGGVPEAPNDGKYYGRRNNGWEQVGQPGVTNVTANTTLNSTHLNRVVEVTVAGPITITIPSGLGAQGDIITVVHSNATGNVTVQGASGVNIYRYGSISAQSITKIGMMSFYRSAASNTWLAA